MSPPLARLEKTVAIQYYQAMLHEHITSQQELSRFCKTMGQARTIAFDTEFVSEDTYHPQLCLIQVAADQQLAVIDALAVRDVEPFWQALAAPDHETIVHSGRYELYFCLRAIGRRPHRLFDTQIAAGLTGLEYPAAYRTLILKLLGKNVAKGETRTDWRRRPLSHRQIEYALQDVVHLQPIRDALVDKLASLGRLPWLEAEIEDWQARVEAAELNESWRRLPGLAALPPRSLAVARELWRWRDELAERQNRHPRRILRDDLLVELARQATDDVHRIRAVRGLHRRDMEQYLQPLAGAIRRGLARPEAEWPQVANRTASRPQFTILGQFLATALTCVCREHSVAPSLVATVDDVRDWVAYRLGLSGFAGGQPPALAQGWRAELLGARFDELFAGNLTLRVTDPRLEQPLVFQARQADAGIAGVRNDGG